MKAFRYRIVVEWSDEDEVFVARVPSLPGCAAHGNTPEDAVREATSAASGILASLRSHGDALPPEDAIADYSGQLRLRIPRSLHERLARLAVAEGVSLNQELVTLLATGSGSTTRGRERKPRQQVAKTRREGDRVGK